MIKQFLFGLLVSATLFANAKENIPGGAGKRKATNKTNKTAAVCIPSTSRAELDVNNVRTTLLGGGDLWWDLSNARYEIPKVPKGSDNPRLHSLFAGALWIGGIDAGGQLKIAAQTYRQTGDDFWPGPLDNNGTVDDAVCSVFDRHWKVTSADITKMIALKEEYGTNAIPENVIPTTIKEWPGRGNPLAVGASNTPLSLSADKPLAPFVDVDDNNLYTPTGGDYPDVKGDQAIWWIYNDRGNTHTETGGEAIGLEVQATAFGFSTNDEVNDMTFYDYKVRNFSTSILDSVYFGQWVDPDLGRFDDDYVGCVPELALGIVYNGDNNDDGAAGYGLNPPLLGVDFFKGPRKYIYNEQNDIVDSVQLGMSKFIYYNNDFSNIGNPQVASHFYGYLSGSWKDGSLVTEGGNGYNTGDPADYMFPDSPGSGGWSECDEGNTPADRRFMQSSGAFRLEPGAQNDVVVGVVWIRPTQQVGCNASFQTIISADEKAQALFDNNFKLIDGPDAPDLTIRELDKELIITLSNKPSSNNYEESYDETDPIIKAIVQGYSSLPDSTNPTNGDSTYTFQGYQVYQLASPTVSPSEYNDVSQARLVAQFDIKDEEDRLINYEFDQTTGSEIGAIQVDGNNEGVGKSVRITDDAFGSDIKTLANNKAYYFSVVAYASNNYLPYDPNLLDPILRKQMQRKPYLAGRRNIKVYQASPHIPDVENKGTVLNANYGDAPELTRLDGIGNGGLTLELNQESIDAILANGSLTEVTYQSNAGPLTVKIVDPLKVQGGEYIIKYVQPNLFNGALPGSSTWELIDPSGTVYESQSSINNPFEQLFPEIGISINTEQTFFPGDINNLGNENGLISSSIEFADPSKPWLTAVPDGEGQSPLNWIRSGDNCAESFTDYGGGTCDDFNPADPGSVYEDVANGLLAPTALTGGLKRALGQTEDDPDMPVKFFAPAPTLRGVYSVDIVLTQDTTKWSRCVVLESEEDVTLSRGGAERFTLRTDPSKNIDGSDDPSSTGKSYFPGYAINVETGERLNIFFAENSAQGLANGFDMTFNPADILQTGAFQLSAGGQHYMYVSNTKYDGCAKIYDDLNKPNPNYTSAFSGNGFGEGELMYCGYPLLAPGFDYLPWQEGLIPSDVSIKVRVHRPFQKKQVSGLNGGLPMYKFNLDGFVPEKENVEVAESALDLIKVVPNPYYAESPYENSALDNRVRITNLPANCTVSIYTTDGALVRRFSRNTPLDNTLGTDAALANVNTSIDWDLKNGQNIPISGGIYIIHIDAPGIGEKVVKWFGVMRPVDLDTF